MSIASVLTLLALAAPEQAPAVAATPATILVTPFSLQGEPEGALGIATAEALIDFLAQINKDNFLTLKQLDSVLRPRQLKLTDPLSDKVAPLARALGATDVVLGEIVRQGDRYTIEARRVRPQDGQVLRRSRQQGARALVPILLRKLSVELFGANTRSPPISRDPGALAFAASCTTALSAQSLSPRAKGTLPAAAVKKALLQCEDALRIDPMLGLARAGKAVALACLGDLSRARSEAQLARRDRFVPLAFLAEAFALRRSGDEAGARGVLEDAVASRPGFLHALGFLGEERMEKHQDQAARADFQRYLKRAPLQPWAQIQLGHALARLGRKDEAVAVTRKALEEDPGDPEVSVELASRLIDAGKDAEAEPYLRAAMDAKPPRMVAGLRLGYLYLRTKRLVAAKSLFQRVVAEATRPDEARTRARAHADLARIAGEQDKLDDAVAELTAARKEGLRKLPCDEPSLRKWRASPRLSALCKEERAVATSDDPDDAVAVDVDDTDTSGF